MKNSKFFKLTILLVLPVMMTAGVFSVVQNEPSQVSAYSNYTEGTLPTTINLNEVSVDTIRNYYSALNNKSQSELSGTNLLKNLKPILSKGQKYFAYDSTSPKNAIWKAYEIVDRDWKLSPAKQISGYNENTGIITGYQYKASNDFNNPSNPYLHALYANREMPNEIKAWGNHDQVQGGINQEHIWPKSHGFDTNGAGGARGDLMHLWAADGYSNKIHSNYSYGFVDKTQDFECTVDRVTYATDNFLGISKTLGTGTVFEPQDSDKGDIARALFYMAARYNNYAGATEGIDSNDPYLVLDDITSPAMEKGSTCTTTNPGKYGILSDLLEWNRLDPVDEFEKHRNDLLYRNYTFNRNPFIDFPEWAEVIWGDNQSGKADPSTDIINKSLKEEDEQQEPLFLKANSISAGDKISIVCENMSNELVSFTGSYGIGQLFENEIKGALVFDVVESGDNYLFVNNNKYLSEINSTNNGLFLSNNVNKYSTWTVDFDDLGNAIISTTEETPRSILWNVGSPRFAAYKNYDDKIKPTSSGAYQYYPIQIYKKNMSNSVTSITLDADDITLEVGKTAQLTPIIEPKKAVDKRIDWSVEDETIATINDGVVSALKIGQTVVTAKTIDGNFTAQCSINVIKAPDVLSIEIGGDYKTLYELNDEYTEDGLSVIAHLNNGKDVDVTSKTEFSSIDTSVIGEKTLTASYGGKTATTNIFVAASSISLDSSLGLENGTALTSYTREGVTYTFAKGSGSYNAPTYYETGDASRFYSNNTIQISCSDKIVRIVLCFASGDGKNEISASVGSFDTDTWTGRSNEVTLTIGVLSGNNRRINKIYVVTDPVSVLTGITLTDFDETVKYMDGNGEVTLTPKLIASYQDGGTKEVEPTECNFIIDTKSLGEKEISASYGGFTTTETVFVSNENAVRSVNNIEAKINSTGEITSKQFDSNNQTLTIGDLTLTLTNNGGYYGYDSDKVKGQQVGSGAKPATEMTLTAQNSETLSEVVVETSGGSSIKATISVSVGGTAFTCGGQEAVSITTTSTEYTFEGTGKGAVVISWSQTSSKAIYFKEVRLTIPGYDEYSWSGVSQAEAWSNYFLSLTGSSALGTGPCSLSTFEEKKDALEEIWDDAKAEYNFMLGDSKDEFYNNTDSLIISQIREHYLYIVQTYGFDSFVTDSESNILRAKQKNTFDLLNVEFDSNVSVSFILAIIGVISVSAYFINKKKQAG